MLDQKVRSTIIRAKHRYLIVCTINSLTSQTVQERESVNGVTKISSDTVQLSFNCRDDQGLLQASVSICECLLFTSTILYKKKNPTNKFPRCPLCTVSSKSFLLLFVEVMVLL